MRIPLEPREMNKAWLRKKPWRLFTTEELRAAQAKAEDDGVKWVLESVIRRKTREIHATLASTCIECGKEVCNHGSALLEQVIDAHGLTSIKHMFAVGDGNAQEY